jgi:hypothetical protein
MMAKRKAVPKRKPSKRKPRKIVPEATNPFLAYGNSLPRNLTHEIRSDIEDGNLDIEELVNAIHTLDQFNNKEPLVKLLVSRSTTEAELLADVIDRYIPKRDRRRSPIYLLDPDHHTMLNALGDVSELRAAGMSVREAITRVAKERGIRPNKLVEWRGGRSRWQRTQRKSARK